MKYIQNTAKSMLRMVILGIILLSVQKVVGQISVATLPYDPAVTNCDAYNPSSAVNLASTIPAGWTATSQTTDVYNGQGNGSSSTGGYWGYGTGGEFSIGALRSGTTGNITYTVSFVNNSGATINSITLSWDYEQWRYGGSNTTGWNCSGTGALAGNATLNAKDFAGSATGTNGVVTVTPVPEFTLSGLSIANGVSFGISWVTTDITGSDNGVAIDNFDVAMCSTPTAVLGTNPSVCQGSTTGSLAYTAMGSPTLYSINYSTAANNAGFVDITDAALPASPIPIVVPGGAPVAAYTAILTFSSPGGCVSSSYVFTVNVISCTAPYMAWVPLHEGQVSGSCISNTDCDAGTQICYALRYTPNATGVLTSYTTGFFIDCSTLGNPVVSNISCVMSNNSGSEDGCMEFSLVKFNSSGNTGSITVTQNVPVTLHQLCLNIPAGQSLEIVEDVITNLTTSIDPTGGGPAVTEYPGFSPIMASWEQECVTLPLRWLAFQAERYDELMSQLDWTTADEINNSHFEIQRSNDHGVNFVTIGKVNAATEIQPINAYQFIDRHAKVGKNYYRLRQVDLDGRHTYSPIRVVTFAGGAFSVKAWPNPVATDLMVSIQYAQGTGNMVLYDVAGHRVLDRSFEGENIFETLDVSGLQPGVYTLIVSDGSNRHVEKIVIVD